MLNEFISFIAPYWAYLQDRPPVALAGVAGLCAICALYFLYDKARARRQNEAALRQQLYQLGLAQNELNTRMQTMAEISVTRQGELSRTLNERLDAVSDRVGRGLEAHSARTGVSLTQLHERLAVIDRAQKHITDLSNEVVSLQDILADKQQRGAFGQGRMEAIISDSLPKNAYLFQPTLSNGTRPDCLIKLPESPGLIIDAKFPLEAFRAFHEARDPVIRQQAEARLKKDVGKHISDIQQRYMIPGEVQEIALMFVPSESIYADLYTHFDAVIQRAYRARVMIVSPSVLMLAVQVIQAVLKDAKMREQAHLIQKEVGLLLADVGRLQARVNELERHFGLAQRDIEQISISAGKVGKRGTAIEQMEFSERQAELDAVGGQDVRPPDTAEAKTEPARSKDARLAVG